MRQYHYLVSGLPNIRIDDNKLPITIAEFKEELTDALSEKDMQLVNLFFLKYDNSNLLGYLEDKDFLFDELGNYSADDFDEIIKQIKEEDNPSLPGVPNYIITFIKEEVSDAPKAALSKEDRLNSLFYQEAASEKNEFIHDWFQFNLNVRNILVALNCRTFNLDVEKYVVGNNEISNLLKTNPSRDFGVPVVFPWFDQVQRIFDEKDFVKQEKMLDLLNWNYLEEESFFHYFSVERVFVYLLQLNILQRWMALDPESGKAKFMELIDTMRGKVTFSSEFDI